MASMFIYRHYSPASRSCLPFSAAEPSEAHGGANRGNGCIYIYIYIYICMYIIYMYIIYIYIHIMMFCEYKSAACAVVCVGFPLSADICFRKYTVTQGSDIDVLFTPLDLCVSSLRRGHANLLCIVPILADDPRRESPGI